MRMLVKILAVICTIFYVDLVFAGTDGTIRGRVTDEESACLEVACTAWTRAKVPRSSELPARPSTVNLVALAPLKTVSSDAVTLTRELRARRPP